MLSLLRLCKFALPTLICTIHIPAQAQDVAVVEMPPYASQAADGTWQGPAVDLFRQAADATGYEYEFVAANEMAAQEAGVRFPVYGGFETIAETASTLPFHVDTIALIGGAPQSNFLTGLLELFNVGFAISIGIVCLLLLLFGFLFWLAEHSDNEDVAADGSKVRGIGHGFWWAGVTATTIGYGDLVPKSVAGRAVAMIWMLFSMALTALLTAYIVSLVGGRQQSTAFCDAISGKHIGYVSGHAVMPEQLTAAERASSFASLAEALRALDANRIDAIAFPQQAAKALAGDRDLQPTSAAIALPLFYVPDAPALKAQINRIVLSPAWQERMQQQFGGEG